MLNLQSREGVIRRALMEHQAGALAWEVRRLEQLNQVSEENAAKLRKEAEEAKELRFVAQQRKDQLRECGERILRLETVVAEVEAKEASYRTTIESLQTEKATWRKDRGALDQQADTLHRENKELSTQANAWSRAKPILASAFGLSQVNDVGELADAAQKLSSAVRRKDEELGILKDEMREVNMGMERELSRVAAERDTYKAKAGEIDKGIAAEERSIANKLAETEKRNKVSSTIAPILFES